MNANPTLWAPLLDQGDWLPVVFIGLMGLAMLVYVVLDGFDLGIGMLFHRATPAQRDVMVAAIGPFWDANETWLVLGVGLLLVAFPKAHGLVLTALYLPVAAMLIGLMLRGVAFEFRVKAPAHHRHGWNWAFWGGSALASVAQGWMLGRYITGFADNGPAYTFAAVIALCLPATYVLLGACWLVVKTEGELQSHAINWARSAWWPFVLGIALIAVVTPWASPSVRERWFAMPDFMALLPIPVVTVISLLAIRHLLHRPQLRHSVGLNSALPFLLVASVVALSAVGLAYSLLPYVVMDRLTIWEAASARGSLAVLLVGACLAVPAITAYTAFAYHVFKGKATTLSYG